MNKQAILDGIADVLEVPSVTEATELDAQAGWDSLAVVVTIGLLDEHAGVQASGEALAKCRTVGEVLALACAEMPA
jgi:acyl carrier protein